MMKNAAILLMLTTTLGFWWLWPVTEELGPQEFAEKLTASRDNLVLVDLRTEAEYAESHIPGALNIAYGSPTFKWRINELDSSSALFLYCNNGVRSMKAIDYINTQGFSSVTLLKGGFSAWRKEKLAQTPAELVPPAELTEESFNRLLDLEHLVIVYFYVPWNTNCRAMGPVLDELSIACKGNVHLMRINTDSYKHLATELGIEEGPVLFFFENGNLLETIEGNLTLNKISERFKLREYVDLPLSGDPVSSSL